MSVRRCARCGSTLGGAARFCPKDGSPLIEGAGARAAPAAPPTPESKTSVRKAVTPKASPALDRAGTLSNKILDARYEVQKKLGEGGMSYVYEARELSRGGGRGREAGLAMRLDHPNVCRILRLGETEDGLIYLVMPYLKGDLLSDREVRVGP